MDWDNLNAVDILSLFTSLCKGEMFITKVEIFPSLFGLEQMKKDSLYGPPKEILEALPSKKQKKNLIADNADPEDFVDDEEKEKQGYNSK